MRYLVAMLILLAGPALAVDADDVTLYRADDPRGDAALIVPLDRACLQAAGLDRGFETRAGRPLNIAPEDRAAWERLAALAGAHCMLLLLRDVLDDD